MRPLLPLLAGFCLVGCTDPVIPEIDRGGDTIILNALLTGLPDYSEAELSLNRWFDSRLARLALDDAEMVSVDDTGHEIRWLVDSTDRFRFRPPPDFVARPGRAYHLRVTTADGAILESTPETVPPPVAVGELSYEFDAEGELDPTTMLPVPTIRYHIGFTDPADQVNFYLTRFRYWQTERYCASCSDRTVFRNGRCVPWAGVPRGVTLWEPCAETCYREFRRSGGFFISDEFSNGGSISNFEVGHVIHNRQNGGLLVEANLLHVSQRAYDYNRRIEQLRRESGSLNAPLPAPVIGNVDLVRQPEGGETEAIGYVTVAGVGSARSFLRSEDLPGLALPAPPPRRRESVPAFCDQLPIGCPTPAYCVGRLRSPTPPEGWRE